MKKKILFAISIVVLLLCAMAVPAFAGDPQDPNKNQNDFTWEGNVGHLYLYEKDSSWNIVDGGAWGKMKYNLSGPAFDFVFNGHGLEPESNYTLIYYPDPWPGTGLICLGSDVVCELGNVHIKGSVDTGDLPVSYDANAGAKIWLVKSSDVNCSTNTMQGWNPAEYLFENNLITYYDTDIP